MTNSQATARFGTWKTAQSPFVIEYDHDVMRRIQREVNSGFTALPHGGLEVGGLLLGTVTGNLIRIDDCEPIGCSHAFGPSFTLSERDHAEIERRLGELTQSTAPVTGRVVGWYHSHTRSALTLTPEDLTLHHRHFPENYQVSLLLRPFEDGSARAGFFVREPGETVIRASTSHLEFDLPSDTLASYLALHPEGGNLLSRRLQPDPVRIDAWREPPSQFLPSPDQRPQMQYPASTGRPSFFPARFALNVRWTIWAALGGVLALALFLVLLLRTRDNAPAVAAKPLRVEAVQRNGDILVSWDPASLGGATHGVLDVQDGGWHSQLMLNDATLAAGGVTYTNKSDVTGFSLRVERADGTPLEGSFTFVAPGASLSGRPGTAAPAAALKPPVVPPLPPAAPDQQPQMQADLAERTKPVDAKAGEITLTEVSLPETKPEEPKQEQPKPVRTFQPPPVTHSAVRQQPPAVVEAPPALQAAPQTGLNQQSASQVPRLAPPPAPKPQSVATPPVVTTPAVAIAPAKPPMPLAGRWVLKPGSVSRSPGVPESVAVYVQEANGTVQGSLDASYRTASGTAEHTSFSFSGKAGSRLSWAAPNGQRGHIEFIPVPGSPDSVEVVWYGADSKQVFDHIVRKASR